MTDLDTIIENLIIGFNNISECCGASIPYDILTYLIRYWFLGKKKGIGFKRSISKPILENDVVVQNQSSADPKQIQYEG